MSESKSNVIECKNISKLFSSFIALKKVSFQVEKNEIMGIIGNNGAGKSTLIRILSGLLKPSSGDVIINGLNFKDESSKIKEYIGVITDKSFLYKDLTISENLTFYAKINNLYDKEKIAKKIESYTKLFNIYNWIHEPIKNLSTGMKKKVEFIRILMYEPSILLIDEPFANLDFKTISEIISVLLKLKDEKKSTIILTTHKIEDSMKICDNLMVLKKGKLIKIIGRNDFDVDRIKSYY